MDNKLHNVPPNLDAILMYSILGDQVNAALDIVDRKGVIRYMLLGWYEKIHSENSNFVNVSFLIKKNLLEVKPIVLCWEKRLVEI